MEDIQSTHQGVCYNQRQIKKSHRAHTHRAHTNCRKCAHLVYFGTRLFVRVMTQRHTTKLRQAGEKPTHCNEHKLRDHTNVCKKRCVFASCDTQPSFGNPGEKPTHCAKHKLTVHIDVVSNQCILTGCDTQPIFGKPGDKPTHCAKHRLDGHVDVRNKHCLFAGCDKQPLRQSRRETNALRRAPTKRSH